MAVLKYALSALAFTGFVTAQTPCSASTTTIQNAGDATALAKCSTFTGDVVIAQETTDNIRIDGMRILDGSLIARNVSRCTEISSTTLERITNRFELLELQILSTLNFPRLSTVDVIKWEALPALQALSFTSQIQLASTVDIQNTQLNSLEGIDLQVVDRFVLTNNPYLKEISVQLSNITEALTVEANARDLVLSFPNLEWAFNMTIRNCSQISMPSLVAVNGSMGVYSGRFEIFTAPNLTSVGQSLSFVSNDALTNITLPKLTTINGGFQIANNTALENINGFPVLETVGGALDFNGNFSDVELPAIKDIRGAFNMQSSEDIDDECKRFRELSGRNDVIKGKFTCAGRQDKPGGADSTPTGSSSSRPSGAAGHIDPATFAVVGVSGLMAAILGLL